MERGGGGRWGRQEQVRQGVSQDGDDRTETGWQREVAQHGQDTGSSLAGQSRPSHAWGPVTLLLLGLPWSRGVGTGTPVEQPAQDWGQLPPRQPAPALLGLPCAVGHRVRTGAGGGGSSPVRTLLPGTGECPVAMGCCRWTQWDRDCGHPALRGSGDKDAQGHPHPSQAFYRVGSPGGLRLGPPKANTGCREHRGHRGAPKKVPSYPKDGVERSGRGRVKLQCMCVCVCVQPLSPPPSCPH